MPFLHVEGRRLFFNQVSRQAGLSQIHFLFIHGLGSSHSFWGPIQAHLCECGYSSVSFDTQGSGLSESGTGADVSIKSIAQDAVQVLRKLSIEAKSVVLVGHSMGGIVAAEVAAQCELLGVVLVGPVLPKPALADVFNARIRTVTDEGMEAMAKVIPDAATGKGASMLAKTFIRCLLLSQNPESYNGLCSAIAQATVPPYENCRCPLLIVAGEEDRTSPVEDCQTILERWGVNSAGKRLEVLAGVGHWHAIESPLGLSTAINNFGSRVSQ